MNHLNPNGLYILTHMSNIRLKLSEPKMYVMKLEYPREVKYKCKIH